MSIKCYAAFKAKEPLKEYRYDLKELGPLDITVKVTHCGICHSDIHLIDNDWKISQYPLVPGHEVVGIVEEAGKEVARLKKGDRVGVGWQSGSCMECEWCIKGEENLCIKSQATCVGHYGGFAEKMRTDSRFAFLIPEGIDSDSAAPLLCGGITVYSPLRRLIENPAAKVGVIGVGGLGHLAIQFANAFGFEVTVFSSTPTKEKEAKSLGAHHFISSRDANAIKKAAFSLDFILSTVNVKLDWLGYLSVLRPNGKLCIVGAVDEPICVTSSALISDQKAVVGSVIGNRTLIKEMLEFAARHKIKAQTETMPLKDVNAAIKKVRDNQARYRMVLEV